MSLFINSLSPNTSEDGKSRDVESERSINHTVDQVRIEISKLRSQSLFETLNGAVNWDNEYSTQATEREKEAHAILQRLKLDYLLARSQDQEGPCLHHTTSNFLANRHAMEDTPLLNIFKKMPKAGDLHVHFNACLPAHILLDIAANMEQMYITSDRALVHSEDFENCEIQFQILSQEKALENPGNLFDSDYRRDERQTMKLNSFIQLFPSYQVELQASQWLQKKLIFGVDELYDSQDE